MELIWTVEDIREIFNELDKKTGLDTTNIPILISNNIKRVFGKVCYKDNKIHKVLFSSILTNGNYKKEDVMEVIIHEYAHIYCFYTYSKRCGHNSLFYKHCEELGGVPSRTFKNEALVPREQIYKYTITCKDCGYIVGYKHRLNIEKCQKNYVCGICRGELNITINF